MTPETKRKQPTKIDVVTFMTIVETVRKGVPWTTAAAAAGVSERAFSEWRKRAEAAEAPYRELFDALAKADPELEAELIAVVTGKAKSGNRAAAHWLLQRRFR